MTESGSGNAIVVWKLIEKIEAAEVNRANALLLLREAVDCRRFYIPTKKEDAVLLGGRKKAFPVGTLQYEGVPYFPLCDGHLQKQLEAKLRVFLSLVKADDYQKSMDEIDALLRMGNKSLFLLRSGRLGVYAVYLPKKERADGVQLFPGAALLSVEEKKVFGDGVITVIKVISGAGKLAWLNLFAGQWISLGSFVRDKSDDNLSDEALEFSNRLIGALRVAYKVQRRGQ
ncbi:MAG: hypothetical protein UT41_C0001G0304 [Candidatus Wolfebacteria bacterium GW2011_GWC2_39_22]|uniref:Uncharacterized protein n=1 Tax=Candidatus Wolfebacteria bacterium GW2011_GWC2_39_22 TaxID=1619013 RepID=A0A0G0QQW1_9BACT|nr:MAG: hypothetical protein UT41_C0001G0304 [Candidatus Wolfebacteria bacterium GW2011_GWC2_39_22]HBI25579.1 hypothetical protein [Candidatus Wolfebacteria bacterium]